MASATNTRDMTKGSIWKAIIMFFMPLMAGTFFQMLYNLVDTWIVGRFVGTQALSAVGGTVSALLFVFTSLFVGLSTGATVIASQEFGAGNKKEVSNAVHTAVTLGLIFGLALTIFIELAAGWLMTIMKTPADTVADALIYLRTYAVCMTFVVLYNMTSAIFRAVGDSRHPFYYQVVGTLINIVLDVVFVCVFKWGIAGAAWATVAAQCVCALLSLLSLCRVDDFYRINIRELRIEKRMLIRICRIGIPSAIQSMMFSVSNALIQSYINVFGTVLAAAWAVTGKVDSIFWMIVESLGTALTTFVGQNYGAGNMKRVYRGMLTTLLILSAFMVVFISGIYTFIPQLLSFFSTDSAVIEAGIPLERFFVFLYIPYLLIPIFQGALKGVGDVVVPTIVMVVGICGLRILWLWTVVPLAFTWQMVTLSYPISWFITSMVLMGYFYFRHYRRRKMSVIS